MKYKRSKIRLKHKPFWFGLLVALYMVVSIGFVSQKSDKKRCTRIDIEIADSSSHLFVSPKDVYKLLKDNNFDISGYPIKNINDLDIENSIEKHPSIENAEVYKSYKGRLHILILQRNPIVRILDKAQNSYYIDENGKLMPLSENYTARVPVITGDFVRAYDKFKDVNLSEGNSDSLLCDLFLLSKELKNNTYWSALCDQIVVNQKNEIILIPKIGAKKIILGQNSNFAENLEILTEFYHQALPYVGWEKYKTISLKYNNQIVCVK